MRRSVYIKLGLTQRGDVIMMPCLLILLVQLYLKPLASDFKSIHLINGLLCGPGILKANKSNSFAFAILFRHDSSAQNGAKPLK